MNTKEELIKGMKRLIEIAFAPEQFATELDLNIHAGVGEAPTSASAGREVDADARGGRMRGIPKNRGRLRLNIWEI